MSKSEIETGYTVGGGLEYALDEDWSLKTEYLYVDLGDQTVTSPAARSPRAPRPTSTRSGPASITGSRVGVA